MGKFSMWILRLMGWTIKEIPQHAEKAVILMGPHTSNWDFIIGRLAFAHYGVEARYLIKSELFFPPLGWLLKAIGGIPIKIGKNNKFTDQAAKYFNENKSMYMIFTPEGTRSYNPRWKKGFYHIALKANVPIYIGYMDFPTKTGGFLDIFHPTGNVDNDITFIKKQLSQFKGKNPENGIRAVEDE